MQLQELSLKSQMYLEYFGQQQEDVDKIMKHIIHKNELWLESQKPKRKSFYERLQSWGKSAGQAIRN